MRLIFFIIISFVGYDVTNGRTKADERKKRVAGDFKVSAKHFTVALTHTFMHSDIERSLLWK